MTEFLRRSTALLVTAGWFALRASSAGAELYINEIFFDPGGGGSDSREEYIELRGTPSASLEDHYLVFLENESDEFNADPGPGVIENVFDLGAHSLGTNGFLTLRQKSNLYDILRPPAPGTTDLQNTGADTGWGSGEGSSIGHTGEEGKTVIENSGFTAMLIRNDGDPLDHDVPTLGYDMDIGNDGLDFLDTGGANWVVDKPPVADPETPENGINWTILDSIGTFSEFGEAFFGRLYGQVNFGPEVPGQEIFPGGPVMHDGNIEEGTQYVGLNFEVEYLGRWGNSTGHSPDDWHVSNLTDDQGAGSLGIPDFRQSCIDGTGCHPANDGDPDTPAPQPASGTESNKDVPYGTQLVTSLGAPNYLQGDYNGDGVVDAADYTVWRDSLGQTANEQNHHPADHNHDFLVGPEDYDLWKANYGSPVSASGSGATAGTSSALHAAVPEPMSLALATLAGLVLTGKRRNRRSHPAGGTD